MNNTHFKNKNMKNIIRIFLYCHFKNISGLSFFSMFFLVKLGLSGDDMFCFNSENNSKTTLSLETRTIGRQKKTYSRIKKIVCHLIFHLMHSFPSGTVIAILASTVIQKYSLLSIKNVRFHLRILLVCF